MDHDTEQATEETGYGYGTEYDYPPDGSDGYGSAEGGYDQLAGGEHVAVDGYDQGAGGAGYGDAEEGMAEGLTSQNAGRIGKGMVMAGVGMEVLAPATGPFAPVMAVAGGAVLLAGLAEEWIADENPDVEPQPVPPLDIPSHEETTLRSSSVSHEDPPPPAADPN